MANKKYPIKGVVLQVYDGTTTVTLAMSQGGTLTTNYAVTELRGAESIKRDDATIDNVTINISLSNLKWDSQVIGFVYGTTTADTDVDGDTKTGYTRYTIGDTYDPDLTVIGTFTSQETSGKEFKFKATGCVPDGDLAFPWGTDGYLPRDISLSADDIALHAYTS